MSTDHNSTGTSTQPAVIAVNLAGEKVGAGWGRARAVAVATVTDGHIDSWQVEDVRWDIAHDQAGEGSHHARVVRFLRDHGVQAVVTGHMGPPMAAMLGKLGVLAIVDASGDARAAALAGAAILADRA